MEDMSKDSEQYGAELVMMMQYLALPDRFIKSLVPILDELDVEQIEDLYASLKKATIEKLAIEADPEYQKMADKIDQETLTEIAHMINE